MSSDTLEKISDEIQTLPEFEQLLLASRILDRLVSERESSKRLDLRDLRDTGEGTWSKENVQAYINKERNGWER
jgi:hypothetical protein